MMIKDDELNEIDDDLAESDFSDGELIDLEFELSEVELDGLKEAFTLMMG